MQIQVHSIHFDADVKLINFIEDKVSKLDQFHDQIIGSKVYLRIDNDDKNENKLAEIKINVPGKELFAKKQCKTFEEAIDASVEALRRQLRKHKTKLKSVG